jgi:hypothetical protein
MCRTTIPSNSSCRTLGSASTPDQWQFRIGHNKLVSPRVQRGPDRHQTARRAQPQPTEQRSSLELILKGGKANRSLRRPKLPTTGVDSGTTARDHWKEATSGLAAGHGQGRRNVRNRNALQNQGSATRSWGTSYRSDDSARRIGGRGETQSPFNRRVRTRSVHL